MGDQSQAAAPPPTGDQPSAAPPGTVAEGGGGEGGVGMPLMIGGVVVLLLLGIVGAYTVFSGSTDVDGGETGSDTARANEPANEPVQTGGVDPSQWTYFGVPIGGLEHSEHGVSGKVHAATENILCLTEFSYDGTPAVFMVGTTDVPDGNGEELRDFTKRSRSLQARALKKYTSERVILKLPKPIKEYKYLSVYSKEEKKSYGDVKLENFNLPAKQLLGQFEGAAHDVKSSSNTLLDSKRIEIKGFHIDDQAPATFFSVGKGPITKDSAQKINDEALHGLVDKDFVLTLPGDKTWDQYEWLSAYCFNAEADLGNFRLPDADSLTVPVYIDGGNRRRRALQRRARLENPILGAESGKPRMLACTFGEFGVKRAMVPPDGICDVIFYTDVEYDSDQAVIVSTDGGPAFGIFKSAVKKYTKTTFGTSMSTGSITDAVQNNVSDLKASMDELFHARLIHFGMLNVENMENYDNMKNAELKYLKVVAEFLKAKKPPRRYHSALGISLRDSSRGDKIQEIAKQAPRDFPGLTMIVFKIHTDSVGKSGEQWPVAPNPDGVEMSKESVFSLATAKDEVKNQLMEIARHGRYAMLSFAVYARTYHMKATWSEVSVREMSESSLNVDYAAVCKMKADQETSDSETMYAADKHRKFLALFDSPATFQAKTKARLGLMPKNFTGLALYNVEMDDYKGACGKGRFALLRAIKAALAG